MADPAFVELVVRALAELGHERAVVVHGEPGLDELSPCGATRVAELRRGEVSTWRVTPAELGLEAVAPEALAGGEPEENAEVVRAVVAGEERGAGRAAVLVNAAAAYYVAGRVASLADGVAEAGRAIDSGEAARVLERLVRVSRAAA